MSARSAAGAVPVCVTTTGQFVPSQALSRPQAGTRLRLSIDMLPAVHCQWDVLAQVLGDCTRSREQEQQDDSGVLKVALGRSGSETSSLSLSGSQAQPMSDLATMLDLVDFQLRCVRVHAMLEKVSYVCCMKVLSCMNVLTHVLQPSG